ncbi:MAG TPA: 5,10-methylenetetrahydrofolate reductase [bacterium]|nr:5,10-methylenetetrahydrofolate reductase [bacterium]
MLYTELKKIDEILKLTRKEKRIFLIGCNGCAEVCETGGEKALNEMEMKLEENGKEIVGKVNIEFLCSRILVMKKLKRYLKKIENSEAILVFSCGIGVQVVSKVIDKPVYPATDTVYLGGFQGLWPGEERCEECGMCYLGITGGICPITFCTKQLVNGPCGGANNGKCEIDPEKDCGWVLIYERLRKINKLDILKEIQKPRDFKKMEPSKNVKGKIFFNIDK